MKEPKTINSLKSKLTTSEWAIGLLYIVSLLGLLTGVSGIIPAVESVVYIPTNYIVGLMAVSVILFGFTYYMNQRTKHLALKLEELNLD